MHTSSWASAKMAASWNGISRICRLPSLNNLNLFTHLLYTIIYLNTINLFIFCVFFCSANKWLNITCTGYMTILKWNYSNNSYKNTYHTGSQFSRVIPRQGFYNSAKLASRRYQNTTSKKRKCDHKKREKFRYLWGQRW